MTCNARPSWEKHEGEELVGPARQGGTHHAAPVCKPCVNSLHSIALSTQFNGTLLDAPPKVSYVVFALY